MILTANSEATAQEIGNWKAYSTTNMWYAVRVICWLGQGSEAGSTTLYYKWQKSAAMNGYSAYNHNRRRFFRLCFFYPFKWFCNIKSYCQN